jgi:hypothetical protein
LNLEKFTCMNKHLALLTGGLMAANALCLAPAQAETGINFYCGQTYSLASKNLIPTTMVSIAGKSLPVAIIQWRSRYLSSQALQSKCNEVSAKFHRAYQAGKMNYFAAGRDRKTGEPVICGLTSTEENCGTNNLLFTLAASSNEDSVLNNLNAIFQGKTIPPIEIDI